MNKGRGIPTQNKQSSEEIEDSRRASAFLGGGGIPIGVGSMGGTTGGGIPGTEGNHK